MLLGDKMSVRNTKYKYGQVAKIFHWLTALLFLLAYISVYYRHWFTENNTSENWIALQLHLSFGVTVLVLFVLRVYWRWSNVSPNPEDGSKLEHLAAKLGHWALYGLMLIVPLTGYIGTSVDTEFYMMFDIVKFESTDAFQYLVADQSGMSFKEFEKPIDFIHKEILGKWLTWMLILGHAGAALYHHFVRRDRTLEKMI